MGFGIFFFSKMMSESSNFMSKMLDSNFMSKMLDSNSMSKDGR